MIGRLPVDRGGGQAVGDFGWTEAGTHAVMQRWVSACAGTTDGDVLFLPAVLPSH
jgi:hypothetical protein